MKCLDKFMFKMNLEGGSLKNENINNSKKLLETIFADDASCPDGIYFWEHGLKSYNDKNQIKIRFYDRKFSNANGITMKFQTLIDTPIIVGDILYDSISDEYWICTESFNINSIHWQGQFNFCNWILKWQNKFGDILEYPCTDANTTQYNSGEQSNKQFTVGSSQHMLTLPCDENTVGLSSPQRFFLDKNKDNPTSFIVTQNDSTSYNYGKKGLIKLTVMEYVVNPKTDRVDLGICDYFDKSDIESDNSDNLFVSKSVIIYDTAIIKSGGDSQTFIGKFYDDEGNEIIGIPCVWKIICDFNDVLEVSKSGNQITIGIDNDQYIDEDIKLILSDENEKYSSDLIISIESLL